MVDTVRAHSYLRISQDNMTPRRATRKPIGKTPVKSVESPVVEKASDRRGKEDGDDNRKSPRVATNTRETRSNSGIKRWNLRNHNGKKDVIQDRKLPAKKKGLLPQKAQGTKFKKRGKLF